MNINKEFSKNATQYQKLNIIQKEIIKKYAKIIDNNSILDLGCGNGSLLDFITPKNYIGIDFSKNMLKLHPHTNIYQFDFDTKECWKFIKQQDFEILVSFSAIQWSKNLKQLFQNIKNLNKPFLLTIFTSNTFKTLHQTANIKSPIYSKTEILENSKIFTNLETETLKYKLYFNNNLEMLRYIKKSGVSGGEKKLSIKQIKNLLNNYPLNYLEFEVVTLLASNSTSFINLSTS